MLQTYSTGAQDGQVSYPATIFVILGDYFGNRKEERCSNRTNKQTNLIYGERIGESSHSLTLSFVVCGRVKDW